ncbi:MAG: SH3 domain-containing protein, partial [Chloroflexota bacterium]
GPVWMPTHVVPAAGLAAWAAPDPSQPAVAQLAPGVQLMLVEQQGAWARVVGSNGWVGWVDGRLLARMA